MRTRSRLTPAGVEELTHGGHRVLIERGAGQGSGITDDDYRRVREMDARVGALLAR